MPNEQGKKSPEKPLGLHIYLIACTAALAAGACLGYAGITVVRNLEETATRACAGGQKLNGLQVMDLQDISEISIGNDPVLDVQTQHFYPSRQYPVLRVDVERQAPTYLVFGDVTKLPADTWHSTIPISGHQSESVNGFSLIMDQPITPVDGVEVCIDGNGGFYYRVQK
jgi:hypothetical protein